jgi:hypothetical protein
MSEAILVRQRPLVVREEGSDERTRVISARRVIFCTHIRTSASAWGSTCDDFHLRQIAVVKRVSRRHNDDESAIIKAAQSSTAILPSIGSSLDDTSRTLPRIEISPPFGLRQTSPLVTTHPQRWR